MAQHNLDSGTALRAFESRAREKRDEIRTSLELGLISADPRLAATITAFQTCLDDIISSLSLTIRTGSDSGYQEIDSATKAFWEATKKRLYGEIRIRDLASGERRAVRKPLEKLLTYLNNLAVSAGVANVVDTGSVGPPKLHRRLPGLVRPNFRVRYISASSDGSIDAETDTDLAIQKYEQLSGLLQSIDRVLEQILRPAASSANNNHSVIGTLSEWPAETRSTLGSQLPQ